MDEKIVKMWTMGSGNSAKRFAGEDPIPEKKKIATKDSWTIKSMPEQITNIPMNFDISKRNMDKIKMGHIPEEMEDHWFMYCDNDTIRYYRSWTGYCIYIGKYEEVDEKYRIINLQVNRDPSQYKEKDDNRDKNAFLALVTDEYGGDSEQYWNEFFK